MPVTPGAAEPEGDVPAEAPRPTARLDALAVILGQRACRQFSDEEVSDGDIEAMLQAATHAPSAENRQPWVFVVVRELSARSAINDLTRDLWRGGARAHSERTLSPTLFAEVDAFFGDGYGGAPVLVVVAGDGRDGSPSGLLASSVFPATQNLLLAAASLGYGSSMTTLAAQVPADLGEIIGLPAGVRPFALVPIGRPAIPLGPPRRRPVAEVAHLDRFGVPFPHVSDVPLAPAERPRPAPPPSL